jgi:hypothetical protein
MMIQFAKRMAMETDKRLLWKLAYNFGYKGMRSVQRFKKRLKHGVHFPPSSSSRSSTPVSCAARGAGWTWNRRGRCEKELIEPTPIGLYFARLWYFERLYPLIFAVGGLASAFAASRDKSKSAASDLKDVVRKSPAPTI